MVSSRKHGVALADVARMVGVSTATVSLALQQGSRISGETREKVRKAVEKTGYRYNRVAANLRTGQSKTIGLIITDIANPYFAALAAGVESELDRFGYMTFLVNSADDDDRQLRQLSSLREHGVDGVLLSPAEGTDPDVVLDLIQSGVPVVQVSRWVAGIRSDVVTPDNVKGAADATRHLLASGHRRIAFIGGTETRSAGMERMSGYAQALQEAGIVLDPTMTPTAAPTRTNGAVLLRSLMKSEDPPTAILCYHDLMALGTLDAADDLGLKAGRDIAIIGFDDITEAALSHPPLSTVHVDAESIGRVAATRLIARMQGDSAPPQRIIIPARLVIRESCGGSPRRN